jgi:hypothetical protein
MMAGLCFCLFSCQNKEILLPRADQTVVANVQDHSPIYFFFKTQAKDTLIEVNRKNAISSTNWLFNIDKRLPLKLVIPEIKKLQSKKEASLHKNEISQNFFTYADTVKKTMAFLPFTKVQFKFEKPDVTTITITFDENNLVHFKDAVFSKEQLAPLLNQLLQEKPITIIFCFSQKLLFGTYIQDQLFLKKITFTNKDIHINTSLEYIY